MRERENMKGVDRSKREREKEERKRERDEGSIGLHNRFNRQKPGEIDKDRK